MMVFGGSIGRERRRVLLEKKSLLIDGRCLRGIDSMRFFDS